MSEMPSIFFSLTSSAIFCCSTALFTWYGISSTMIAWRLPALSMSSKCVLARITTRPRPVR